MTRFLFWIPCNAGATGGINVILELNDLIRAAALPGVSSEVVCARADYRYPFVTPEPEMLYEPKAARPLGRRERLRSIFRRAGVARNRRLDLAPADVIVVPEFASDWLPRVFPRNRCVLLVQNHHGAARIGVLPAWQASRFAATIVISRSCQEAAEVLGLSDIRFVPLCVDGDRFRAREPKRNIIAYMPRKRPEEVKMVVELLRRRGNVAGYEFRPIAGLTADGVAEAMADARFFLSFSQREGFGLPPAEAMAAGCIVIGFTGVGGDEFFDDEVGIPVADGDIVGFVRSVEAAVREHETAPDRLEAMRRRAAARMRDRYSRAGQRKAALEVFGALGRELA